MPKGDAPLSACDADIPRAGISAHALLDGGEL
jgi:hypothetical protein